MILLNWQASGSDRINRVKAFIAIYIRLQICMDPDLSTRKMKWKSDPLLSLVDSGFSSLTTAKKSYGATGSKVGTRETAQTISVLSGLSA